MLQNSIIGSHEFIGSHEHNFLYQLCNKSTNFATEFYIKIIKIRLTSNQNIYVAEICEASLERKLEFRPRPQTHIHINVLNFRPD